MQVAECPWNQRGKRSKGHKDSSKEQSTWSQPVRLEVRTPQASQEVPQDIPTYGGQQNSSVGPKQNCSADREPAAKPNGKRNTRRSPDTESTDRQVQR